MKYIFTILGLVGLIANSQAESSGHSVAHQMQHGFILSANDTFASHLVATGYHSRQTDVLGSLSIDDESERSFYEERKSANAKGESYFLLQAQAVDLTNIKEGQMLTGHIIESKVGDYEPKRTIVKKASFTVEKVLLNLENPFFTNP